MPVTELLKSADVGAKLIARDFALFVPPIGGAQIVRIPKEMRFHDHGADVYELGDIAVEDVFRSMRGVRSSECALPEHRSLGRTGWRDLGFERDGTYYKYSQ